MSKTFIDKLPLELKNFYVKKIAREASTKIIYKIFLNKKSFIGIDFNKNEYEYKQFIYIYNILSKIDISIPEIIYRRPSLVKISNSRELTSRPINFRPLRTSTPRSVPDTPILFKKL